MSNSKQKSKETFLSHLRDRDVDKRSLIIGSILGTLIAATPFFFYLHESVPETEIWDTFLFTFESHFFQNANQAMWLITVKVIPLMLLFIWFFTCRHWWYHSLLVPIAMFSYQLVSLLVYEVDYMDEFQLIYMVPVMAVIIPSIYLVRAKMFYKINDAGKSMEELEEEFKIKPKSFVDKLSDYF